MTCKNYLFQRTPQYKSLKINNLRAFYFKFSVEITVGFVMSL
jgi:hypothetical protein